MLQNFAVYLQVTTNTHAENPKLETKLFPILLRRSRNEQKKFYFRILVISTLCSPANAIFMSTDLGDVEFDVENGAVEKIQKRKCLKISKTELFLTRRTTRPNSRLRKSRRCVKKIENSTAERFNLFLTP